jgi:hypothetical protein
MTNPLDYTLTKHAIERLLERDPDFSKICQTIEAVSSINLPVLKLKAAYNYMKDASEERSFLNNSVFMTKLGEKYGFDNSYTLFVKANSVFVGVSNQRGNAIVTVLSRGEHYISHIKHKIKKFEKKAKKEFAPYFPPGKSRH